MFCELSCTISFLYIFSFFFVWEKTLIKKIYTINWKHLTKSFFFSSPVFLYCECWWEMLLLVIFLCCSHNVPVNYYREKYNLTTIKLVKQKFNYYFQDWEQDKGCIYYKFIFFSLISFLYVLQIFQWCF